MRIIKLLLPSQNSIKINISDNENELKELISAISSIPIAEIKGLKDSYGIYHTFSSIIQNPLITSNQNNTFSLISSECLMNIFPINSNDSLNSIRSVKSQSSARKQAKRGENINTDYIKNMDLEKDTEYFFSIIANLINKKVLDESQSYIIKRLILEENEKIMNLFYCYVKNSIYFNEFTSGLIEISQPNESMIINNNIKQNSKSQIHDFFESLYPSVFTEYNDVQLLKNLVSENNQVIISSFNQILNDKDKENFIDKSKIILENFKRKSNLNLNMENLNHTSSFRQGSSEFGYSPDNRVNHTATFSPTITPPDNQKNSITLFEKKGSIVNTLSMFVNPVNNHNDASFNNQLSNNTIKIENQENINSEKKKDEFMVNICPRVIEHPDKKLPAENGHLTFEMKKSEIQEEEIKKSENIQRIADQPNLIQAKSSSKKGVSSLTMSILKKKLPLELYASFKYLYRTNLNDITKEIKPFELNNDESGMIESAKKLTQNFLNEVILTRFKDSESQKIKNLLKNKDKNIVEIFNNFKQNLDLKIFLSDLSNLIIKISDQNDTASEKEEVSKNNLIIREPVDNLKDEVKDFLEMVKRIRFLTPEQKEEYIQLFNSNDEVSMNILKDYLKTKNIASLKNNLLDMLKSRKEPQPKPNSNLKPTNTSPQRTSNNKFPDGYEEFNRSLTSLVQKGLFSEHLSKFFIQRFISNDDFIIGAWQCYKLEKNDEDFVETLKICSRKVGKRATKMIGAVTPINIQNTKKEIINFLKYKNNDEKEEIKKKQKNVLEILLKEQYLSKEIKPLIIEMIENESNLLISALEIYSVTKDHRDFCETLELIYDIYNTKSKGEPDQIKNQNSNVTSPQPTMIGANLNAGQLECVQILNTFLNENSNVINDKEQKVLRLKLKNKDMTLISAIDFYKNYGNAEDFLETLKMLAESKK